MTRSTRALAFTLALVAFFAAGVSTSSATVLDPDEADLCEPLEGNRFICLSIGGSAEQTGEAGGPAANACMYDETFRLVLAGFHGVGQLACLETHYWSYLGIPGACVGTGRTGSPTGCVAADKDFDYDRDGIADETKHCLVWLAGSSYCWHD